MRLTKEIIAAATLDAGNRSMRAGGRTSWNEEDSAVAWTENNRLWDLLDRGLTAGFATVTAKFTRTDYDGGGVL